MCQAEGVWAERVWTTKRYAPIVLDSSVGLTATVSFAYSCSEWIGWLARQPYRELQVSPRDGPAGRPMIAFIRRLVFSFCAELSTVFLFSDDSPASVRGQIKSSCYETAARDGD
jgi:hypothetical protein